VCESCLDIVLLKRHGRHCECGRSWGRYLDDGSHSVYSGPCRMLGLANRDLEDALRQPDRYPVVRCWLRDESGETWKRVPDV
jgi:hypothetical protein